MEQWKQIVVDGIEYDYEVSTLGRVRNKKQQIIRAYENKDGYYRVTLSHDNIKKHYSVHRLVALMFIPKPQSDKPLEVDHIDRNKQNNTVDNLRWTDRKGNIENRIGNKKRVLCVETQEIFESLTDASRKMNVHESNLSKCVNGIYATCGGFHWEYVD